MDSKITASVNAPSWFITS